MVPAPSRPLARRIRDLILPEICPVTYEEVGGLGGMSAKAWGDLAFLSGAQCHTCGREIPGRPKWPEDFRCEACVRRPPLWERGGAAIRYEGTGRHLVMRLKHADRLDLVPMFARWMRAAAPHLVEEADLIVPIPLHWTRLAQRRYNQSAELARRIARQAGKPFAAKPRLLRRVRATPVQGGLNRAGRVANLEGAIRVAPAWRRHLAGKRVLLIDDVLTTGATLEAATQPLLEVGARVDVLVTALVNYDPTLYMRREPIHEDLSDETD
ncbi:MAG: ComF family protein [Pseudomonadota bacterium]